MKTSALPKILVAVHVFPSQGGGRIEKLVKFLPQCGVEPIVMSPRETLSPNGRRLLETFYPDLESHYVRSIGPTYFAERLMARAPTARDYRLLNALSFPERCVYLPDYMVRWVPLGVRLGRRLISEKGIRVVLTSSPPESTHLVGLALKRQCGVKWIADFRDLWTARTLLYRPATVLHDRWIRRLERTILENADHVIANTDENLQYYLKTFGINPRKVTTIPNGFDRDDVPASVCMNVANDLFRIGYMGNLSKHDLPWRPFLRALKLLSNDVGSHRVRFVQVGPSSREVDDAIREMNLEDIVVRHGDMTHHEAMRITASTTVRLVLLAENGYSRAMVPAKLYNYLIMDGPILAVSPTQGAAARVLSETGAGTLVPPTDDGSEIYRQLRAYFEKWQRGDRLIDVAQDRIDAYDRRRHAEALTRIFERLNHVEEAVSRSTQPATSAPLDRDPAWPHLAIRRDRRDRSDGRRASTAPEIE